MAKRAMGGSEVKISTPDGKIPPQSIEFEEAVLGALLIEKEAFQEVEEILEAKHFYLETHQRIYSAMMSLSAAQKPIDMLMVCDQLKKSGELDFVGGRPYIIKLTQKVSSAVDIEYHARVIFQKYIQRELIHLGTSMQNDAYNDNKDVDDILEGAENDLFTLSQGALKRDVVPVSSVIGEAIRQMKEAEKRTDSISGIPSGFMGIDEITSGWQPSTMVVIAARPAMGKTAFVLSMARKMAVDHGLSIAIFSLEMSNTELVKRFLVAETEIPMEKIKNGKLTPEEWAHFNKTIPRLADAKLFIDDTPGLSIFDLRSKARMLHKKHRIDMIIIDYLQLMTAAAAKPGNRQEEVSMISRSLKGLAKELNIPVIALSQLNRNVEGRSSSTKGADSNRPQLSDLRESGAIEQDADMVCFIHRPEYYKIYTEGSVDLRGKAYFIIAKHRSGAIDDVLLEFKAELVRFEDASPSDIAAMKAESSSPKTKTVGSGLKNVAIDEFASSNGALSDVAMPDEDEQLLEIKQPMSTGDQMLF